MLLLLARPLGLGPSRRFQIEVKFAATLLHLHTELLILTIDVLEPINQFLTVEQRQVLNAENGVGPEFLDIWKQVSESNPEAIETAFRHTLPHIKPVLHDMVVMLSAMVKHTGISYDAGTDMLRMIIADHKDGTFSMRKHLAKRFKFASSDPVRNDLINQMRENIKLLKSLVKGEKKITDFFAAGELIESQQSQGPFLDTVRNHSSDLYNALSTMWRCMCHRSPSAMLRLERRETSEFRVNELQFSLILTYEHAPSDEQPTWAFREAKICVTQK